MRAGLIQAGCLFLSIVIAYLIVSIAIMCWPVLKFVVWLGAIAIIAAVIFNIIQTEIIEIKTRKKRRNDDESIG